MSHTHWALVSILARKISHIRYSQIKILFSCSDLIENEMFCVRCAIVSTITLVAYRLARSLLCIYYVDECPCDFFQQNKSCIMYNINTCPTQCSPLSTLHISNCIKHGRRCGPVRTLAPPSAFTNYVHNDVHRQLVWEPEPGRNRLQPVCILTRVDDVVVVIVVAYMS